VHCCVVSTHLCLHSCSTRASTPSYPLSKSGCCTSCREAYAYERKIRRARNKQNRALAEQLAARRPTHRLDHLVRERCAVNAPFFGAMLLMAAPPCFVSL